MSSGGDVEAVPADHPVPPVHGPAALAHCPEFTSGDRDHVFRRSLLRDVRGHGDRRRIGVAQLLHDQLNALLVDIGDHGPARHVRDEPGRRRDPDPACGTRDNNYLAGYVHHFPENPDMQRRE
jgi:hypothetical protein